MTTIEYSYKETDFSGNTKLIPNKTVEHSIENPHVANEWISFIGGLPTEHTDGFYTLAYILDEYRDQIADDLEDLDEDDLHDTVVAIEREQAEPSKREQERKLKELLDGANAAEREAILEDAEDLLENSDLDDSQTHEAIVNNGGEE